MYGGHFPVRLMVVLDHDTPRMLAHADDVVTVVHPVFFDPVHGWDLVSPATVEFGGMHVDDYRFTRNALRVEPAGYVSQSCA